MEFEEFREVWFADFEFTPPHGHLPDPICMVAREMRSGRILRLWGEELVQRDQSPIPEDGRTLFVAYYASAEVSCYLSLGWPGPVNVLDLYVEFRCHTCERDVPCGRGLLGALTYFGIDGIATTEKDAMRQLAQRGGPYTATERQALLDYCQSDVDVVSDGLKMPGLSSLSV